MSAASSVTPVPGGGTAGGAPASAVGPRYKWIALSNTTIGMLMATINASILLIALPDIFRGIGVNPPKPGKPACRSS